MLKIKDEAGKVIGVLKDDDNEPKMEEDCDCDCGCKENGPCEKEDCCCKEGDK